MKNAKDSHLRVFIITYDVANVSLKHRKEEKTGFVRSRYNNYCWGHNSAKWRRAWCWLPSINSAGTIGIGAHASPATMYFNVSSTSTLTLCPSRVTPTKRQEKYRQSLLFLHWAWFSQFLTLRYVIHKYWRLFSRKWQDDKVVRTITIITNSHMASCNTVCKMIEKDDYKNDGQELIPRDYYFKYLPRVPRFVRQWDANTWTSEFLIHTICSSP